MDDICIDEYIDNNKTKIQPFELIIIEMLGSDVVNTPFGTFNTFHQALEDLIRKLPNE